MSTRQFDIEAQFMILDVRFGQLLNIWTVLLDYYTGRYFPSFELKVTEDDDYRSPAMFPWTFMSLLYSFFFSLVDTHSKGINAFRIWRSKFPEHLAAIEAVEFRVNDILPELKKFRDKLGFHGSRTADEEEIGYQLLDRHGSVKILNVIQHFISLSVNLISLDNSTDPVRIKQAMGYIKNVEEICKSNSVYDFNSEEMLLNWVR